MKTVAFELNVRALFFVFAFALVGCQQEEFYEKEYLENPFNPPTTVGGTDGGSTGGTDGGSSVGGTDGGSSVGGTDGGSSVGGTDGGSTGGDPVLTDAEESFTQVADNEKELDIIWVVDNSGSMAPFQTSLANNFSLFINDFITRGIDFQMGITTTDTSTAARAGAAVTGSLQNLTSVKAAENSANFITNFQNYIKVGTSGSGTERGLLGAQKFLERYQASWMRENSRLVIVFVSDEEDQSPGSAQSYLNTYLAAKSNLGADYLRAYSIVRQGSCTNGGGVICGYERYAYQSNNTGGTVSNLNGNFASLLSDMGQDIQNLIDTFNLEHEPAPGTLVVRVNGQIQANTWTINGRNLKFNADSIPAVGSSIQVNYQY